MEVVLSDQAKNDIADIYAYILNTLQSKINADAVLAKLYSTMDNLSFMAESYHLYQTEGER